MLYTYVKLSEKDTKLDEPLQCLKKNGQKIIYFSNEQFNQYRKLLEEENRTVSVVRNTKLKIVKDKERDKIFSQEYENEYKNKDFLKIDNNYYQLIDERCHSAKGYLYVGDDKFIRIEKMNIFILLLLFGALLALLLAFLFMPCGNDKPDNNNPPVVDNTPDNDNNTDNPSNIESIKFKGFKTAIVSKKTPYIYLNNDSNTSFGFVYRVSEKISYSVVETFNTYDDAIKYVRANGVAIENDYSSNNYSVKVNGKTDKYYTNYVINRVTDRKYEVVAIKYKVLYFTGAITSGSSEKWNAYEMLSRTTDLHFTVSAYNFEKKTYDTEMSFDATVVVK